MEVSLSRAKWFLWHGNADNALDLLDDCYTRCNDPDITYKMRKKFLKYLGEMDSCIRHNAHMIPNYAQKYRYGETITTAFVESTVNEVVSKRMVKKQQTQWSHAGVHYLLQTRTAVLNGDLREHF